MDERVKRDIIINFLHIKKNKTFVLLCERHYWLKARTLFIWTDPPTQRPHMPGKPAGMPLCFVTFLKWSHCWLLISTFLLFHREKPLLPQQYNHDVLPLKRKDVFSIKTHAAAIQQLSLRKEKKQHMRHVIKSAPVRIQACYFITLPNDVCGTKADPLLHTQRNTKPPRIC